MAEKEEGNLNKEVNGRGTIKVVDRPTFILKTRETENRSLSPSQRNGNKKESEGITSSTAKQNESKLVTSSCLELTSCIQLMDESNQLCENVLDYLLDQQDFLVVGCLGTQGVGKSTILNKLTSSYSKNIFPIQSITHQESSSHCTSGIDIYVTKNRVIYLDTQPILSSSTTDISFNFDMKKGSSDFNNTEINLELQSLQFAAFLFSVCHVIIFVQDWFVDPNMVRFIQTAEMLKPSSTANMDQDYVEHYPHLLFLQNKADTQDFLNGSIETMKDFYEQTFSSSKLQIHSGLSMNHNFTSDDLNLFLIPDFNEDNEYIFHEKENDLIERLKIKIHGVTRNALTSSPMTEKNWFHYVSKVMDVVKKSHLSSEYSRLMP